METAIRWSPNSSLSEQRFLLADIGGRSFSLGKVTSYDGKTLRHDILPTYRKVPPFRAFDWSPLDEKLVAVGQWSGETTILTIDDSAAPLSLPAKHQRLCNAVSFSRAGLVATGLERVRNVECLNLWDVNQSSLSMPPPGGKSGRTVEPYRKYSSSEAISSIKFFTHQPEMLIAGVKGVGVRIYDLRENIGNASLQFQTSRVYNVAIDSLNENYFACSGTGKDTTVQIWDRRSGSPQTRSGFGASGDSSNQTGPVLEYPEAFTASKSVGSASIWSLRYCNGKTGILGALASDGEFKVFETNHGHSRADEDNDLQPVPNQFAERLSTKRVHNISSTFQDFQHPHQEIDRIVSFDFTNLAGSKGTPTAIILRGSGAISIQELSGSPTAFSLSALASLSIGTVDQAGPTSRHGSASRGLYNGVATYSPKSDSTAATLSHDVQASLALEGRTLDHVDTNGSTSLGKDHLSTREAHERHIALRLGDKGVTIDVALNILLLNQQRCRAGYGLNVEKNMHIVADDRWLQYMWSWIERAQINAKHDCMSAGGWDMSYLGVYDIWRGGIDPDQIYRRTSGSNTDIDFSDAVAMLGTSLDETFSDWVTDFPEHRRVCLHTCGLGLSVAQVEDSVEEMIATGEKTKAAALAIIHGQGKLALRALRAGTVSGVERELSLALAGYVNGLRDNSNDTWHETIQDLATNLEDPYARSILALVSHGHWHDVLQEMSLPLRDRVGIALMYLSDEELSQYVKNTTSEAIKAGDIEGIVLTGLGSKAIPLFENYIRKFSDLQTAVLAVSFTSPRYFTDPRVTAWRQTYRTQLNELGMFLQRAQFDVQLSKLSLTADGQSTLSLPARQVSIRCAYCDQCLDRNFDHSPAEAAAAAEPGTNHGIHQGSIFGLAGKSGTVCPKCGRHMPRCVICMHWVGVPDPHTKGAMAKKTDKDTAMASFVNVCLKCWHVSHAGHAEEWFIRHKVCPANGCDCRCAEIDVGVG